MSRQRFLGPRWPDAEEVLLLQAAVLDKEGATGALARWRTGGGNLDALDQTAYKVLPRLYRNLENHGIDDPDLGRLKGIYRHTWYQNRVLLHHAALAIATLEATGVQTMVLKGGAVMALHYHDFAIRPMNDVDILVPTREARRAVDTLRGAGWSPLLRAGESVASMIAVLHAAPFTNGKGGGIDLHWHALEESCWPGAADDFWRASRPLQIEGADTRAQCPTDLLLHVCVHGSRGQPERVLHWIPDALAILADGSAAIDWDRLVAQARRRRLTLSLGHALRYLRETFSAPVPATVIDRLGRVPPSWVERLDYRAQGSETTVFWAIARDVTRYLRLSQGKPLRRRVAGFPAYLQHLWGVERTWQVPVEGARRVGGRLRETRLRVWRPVARR